MLPWHTGECPHMLVPYQPITSVSGGLCLPTVPRILLISWYHLSSWHIGQRVFYTSTNTGNIYKDGNHHQTWCSAHEPLWFCWMCTSTSFNNLGKFWLWIFQKCFVRLWPDFILLLVLSFLLLMLSSVADILDVTFQEIYRFNMFLCKYPFHKVDLQSLKLFITCLFFFLVSEACLCLSCLIT